MAVDTQHDDYNEFAPLWRQSRDCYLGQLAIHKAGALYLPMLGGQSKGDYEKYKMRATFYNATKRTIDMMVGMMFRKDPAITGSDAEDLINNVDMNGTSLHSFAQKAAKDLCTVNRAIVLVDFPNYETTALTRAQAQAENRRPYMSLFPCESLINWRTESINGQDVLVMAVIREVHPIQLNEFKVEYKTKYRVLTLEDGRYIQRLWSQVVEGNQSKFVIESEYVPIKNGQPMDYIPLYIYGTTGQEITPNMPTVYDLTCLNISHYMTTADLEHGAHYAGLPTAVISGHVPTEGQTFEIGSATAWVFADPQAKASYLEFTGQGLDALEKRIEKKEAQMAALGARMLAPDKRAAESAETETIRRGGEQSILAAIALSVSELITESFKEMLEWAGLPADDFDYQVNRDFVPAKMTAQELSAWVAAVQSGAVSQETFFEALHDGEMVKDSLTYEEEQDRISTQPMGLPANPQNA